MKRLGAAHREDESAGYLLQTLGREAANILQDALLEQVCEVWGAEA